MSYQQISPQQFYTPQQFYPQQLYTPQPKSNFLLFFVILAIIFAGGYYYYVKYIGNESDMLFSHEEPSILRFFHTIYVAIVNAIDPPPVVTPPAVTPPAVTPPVVTPPVLPVAMPTPKKCNEIVTSDYLLHQSCLDIDNKMILVEAYMKTLRTFKQGQLFKGLKNGMFTLVLQADGNLVIYTTDGRAVWASNSQGADEGPYKLELQEDGNLVIYAKHRAIWGSGTMGLGVPPYSLELQSNGDIYMTDSTNTVTWQSQAKV